MKRAFVLCGVLTLRKHVMHYMRQRCANANADLSIKCEAMYLAIKRQFSQYEGCADNVYVKNDSIDFITHSTNSHPEPSLF